MRAFKFWFAALLLVPFLAGCAAVTLSTPREKIAAAQLTLKATYSTAADYKARGQLSVASEQAILQAGGELQAAIDAARGVVAGGGSPEAVNAALRLLEERLLALERERLSRGVK